MSPGEAGIRHPGRRQVPDPPEGAAGSARAPPAADLRALHHRPGAHRGAGRADPDQRAGPRLPETRRSRRAATEGPGEEGEQNGELGRPSDRFCLDQMFLTSGLI